MTSSHAIHCPAVSYPHVSANTMLFLGLCVLGGLVNMVFHFI